MENSTPGIYSIYKITNKINGKCYIGYSSDVKRRFNKHKLAWRKSPEDVPKLYAAIQKYGLDNFTFEVIYESPDYDHVLNEMEPHYIKEFNSINNGYNILPGGGHYQLTEEQKQQRKERYKTLINPMLGKKHSDESKLKMSEKRKQRVTSDETKQRMSLAGKLRYASNPNSLFNPWTQKSKDSRIEKIAKEYIITYPDGHEELIKNLKNFCQNNELHYNILIRVKMGLRNQHKGFKCRPA